LMRKSSRFETVAISCLAGLLLSCSSPAGDNGKPKPGGSGGEEPTGGNGGEPMGGKSGSGGHPDAAVHPDAGGSGGAGAGGHDGGSTGGSGGAMASGDCLPSAPKSLFCDPLGTMPKSLKDTGLFPNAPDLTKRPASLHEYVPDPPLWSDGMGKQRLLLLPAGKKIDPSDPKAWDFPVGTVFIKTFFDDTGPGGTPRPIETRFIRHEKEKGLIFEYGFYLYKWNAAGTDADLLVNNNEGDPNADAPVTITVKHMENGKMLVVNNGQPFAHTLPSRSACGDCHEENGMVTQTFIGFDGNRLLGKLTPTSAKTQIQDFMDAGIFTAAPMLPTAITDPNPVLQRIKRFVFGNCVHCHHAMGKEFDLSPENFVKDTVGQPSDAQSVKPPAGWLRVVPGKPDMSVVYRQVKRVGLPMPTMMGSMDRLRPMPPIGVADEAADQDALMDIYTWIMSLPAK
jgi:hypothetical protein